MAVAAPATSGSTTFDIVVDRQQHESKSIIGRLYVNGQPVGYTLEHPWKDNRSDVSCIYQGTYEGFIRADGSKGWRIELKNVFGRYYIQIHKGNYPHDSKGCILIGLGKAKNMVTNSTAMRDKVKRLYEAAGSPSEISVVVRQTLPALQRARKPRTALA